MRYTIAGVIGGIVGALAAELLAALLLGRAFLNSFMVAAWGEAHELDWLGIVCLWAFVLSPLAGTVMGARIGVSLGRRR